VVNKRTKESLTVPTIETVTTNPRRTTERMVSSIAEARDIATVRGMTAAKIVRIMIDQDSGTGNGAKVGWFCRGKIVSIESRVREQRVRQGGRGSVAVTELPTQFRLAHTAHSCMSITIRYPFDWQCTPDGVFPLIGFDSAIP